MAILRDYDSYFGENPAFGERENPAFGERKNPLVRPTSSGENLREVADLAAQTREDVAARNAGDVRGTGLLTKYRPRGGWQDTPSSGGGGGSLRTAAPSELGAPTSFNAGAGAPEPIGVIRGNRQTYVPLRQAGQQFSEGEFATPGQAKQAFNRAAGPAAGGEFEPAEGPPLRLAASLYDKRPELKEAAAASREARYGRLLTERFLKDYGVEDKEKGLILPPGIERLVKGHRPQSAEDVEAILGQIKPEAEKVMAIGTYNDLKNSETKRLRNGAANLYPSDPKMQEFIKTAPIDNASLGWFQEHFARVPQAAATGSPATPPLRSVPSSPSSPRSLSEGSAVSGLGHFPSLREFGENLARPFEHVDEEVNRPLLRTATPRVM